MDDHRRGVRQYGGRVATDEQDPQTGGGFNPPVPTARGGPDYGRFVEAVRALQDLTRGAEIPVAFGRRPESEPALAGEAH